MPDRHSSPASSAINFHVFAATSKAVRAYLDEQTLPQRLAPLDKPLLVIFGEDDRRWRSSSAAEYHAVPGATVEVHGVRDAHCV